MTRTIRVAERHSRPSLAAIPGCELARCRDELAGPHGEYIPRDGDIWSPRTAHRVPLRVIRGLQRTLDASWRPSDAAAG